MSSNDEAVQSTSDSFWEVNCYKRSVHRADDGAKLCIDFMTFIQERAEIEKHYAKSLKNWSHKWNEQITKGPEYGTMELTWQSAFDEAESLADVHMGIKDKLLSGVQTSMKQWKGENFHKPMVGMHKEAKQLDDEFRKAQKPWAKRYVKVQKIKKDYHNQCKLERSATNAENNARGDSALSADQIRRFQEKVENCAKNVETEREKYETALSDLNAYNPKYMEEMTEVFQRSQDFEEKRLRFFKETFFELHRTLDISANEQIPRLYEQFRLKIDEGDHDKDLKFWSNNHGVGMPMYWPTFEEYSPDMHSISRKDKKPSSGSDGITLTSIVKNESNSEPVNTTTRNSYSTTPEPTDSSKALIKSESYVPSLNPFGDDEEEDDNASGGCDGETASVVKGNKDARPARPQRKPLRKNSNTESNSGEQQVQNPFGDDDDHWDNYDNPLIDEGGDGVPVRAMYDYDGEEDDELSFKVGDVFVKLQDKDEQGWCKGRKDGRVGLFPDNYTEVISQ